MIWRGGSIAHTHDAWIALSLQLLHCRSCSDPCRKLQLLRGLPVALRDATSSPCLVKRQIINQGKRITCEELEVD